MTKIFKTYDEFQIETKLSVDSVISILKNRIYLNESAFRQAIHPSVSTQYYGIFNYPNRFIIKSGSNPMLGGLSSSSTTEIDVEKIDNKTILRFKNNNLGFKLVFIIIFAAVFGLALIGLFTFKFDLYIWIFLLILIAFGILGLGKLIINTILKEQKKYFWKIIR